MVTASPEDDLPEEEARGHGVGRAGGCGHGRIPGVAQRQLQNYNHCQEVDGTQQFL